MPKRKYSLLVCLGFFFNERLFLLGSDLHPLPPSFFSSSIFSVAVFHIAYFHMYGKVSGHTHCLAWFFLKQGPVLKEQDEVGNPEYVECHLALKAKEK